MATPSGGLTADDEQVNALSADYVQAPTDYTQALCAQTSTDYVQGGYGQADYSQKNYVQKDYVQQDYIQQDYIQQEYVQQDYVQQDYGQKDHVQQDYRVVGHSQLSLVPARSSQLLDQGQAAPPTSTDPEDHLEYARLLLHTADNLPPGDKPKHMSRKQAAYQHEALKVLKRLSEKGINKLGPYPNAIVFLAECYGNGAGGLTVDHEKAFHLYYQASKLGHPAATYRVAVCYEIGAGTKRDPSRSKDFYRKAASLGDVPSMYKLALALLESSPKEAVTWLKRAANLADENNPHALHELAMIYERGLTGANIVVDHAYSRELYTQAAQLGYAPSQYRMGESYEHGEVTCFVDPKRSISWYTRAAEQGHPEAELALSGWYLTGCEGILMQNDSQAYAWARRAADKGLSKAEYAIGYYYEMGIGVPQDFEEARRWYQRAAAQANRKAMQRLQELKEYGRAMRSDQVERSRADRSGCLVM